MPHALHAQTPSLQAVDGRGLVVRHVHYHRAQVGDSAQARVEKRCYDPAARPAATWDPRLSARLQDKPATRPNLSSVFSLSGTPLAVESVDAGWQVSLFGEAGLLLENWDGRGSHWLTEYDEFLRPTAVHEQSEGQPARTSERFSYADCSEHSIANNLCARLIRSDDGAGSEQVQAFGINHQPLQQTRRFLNDMELPDWPEDPALREALLEPGTGATTHTRYGATGETLSQTDVSGNRQAFVYGVCGQIKKISLTPASANEHVLLSDLTYNAFAQLEAQTAGNGVTTHALFDPADGRLEELLSTRTDTDTLQHLLYEYDPVGNVVRIQDRALPTRHFSNQRIEPINHYEHDSLYQLISATGREIAGAIIRPELPERVNLPLDTSQLLNYTQHYHYDEAGNLLELKHEGAQFYTRQMIVDLNSNRALTWKEGEAPPDFASQFDANGNLLTLVPGRPMRWDARNHLLEVSALARTEGDNDRERYAYDASGMRLRKCATAQAKSLIHTREVRYLPGLEIRTDSATGERLEVVTVQAGRAHVRYLHWPDIKPDGISNNQLRYSVDDHLGSSTLELDNDARLISHEGYYPFGGTAWWAARSAVEAKYKVVRYSGQERDASGLYYYGLRYYAPWLLRWINPDPGNNPDDLNGYRMVRNAPVNNVDWLGLEGFDFNLMAATALVSIFALIATVLLFKRSSQSKQNNQDITLDTFLAEMQSKFALDGDEVKRLEKFAKKTGANTSRGEITLHIGKRGMLRAFHLASAEETSTYQKAVKQPHGFIATINKSGVLHTVIRDAKPLRPSAQHLSIPQIFETASESESSRIFDSATRSISSKRWSNTSDVSTTSVEPSSAASSRRNSYITNFEIGGFFESKAFKNAQKAFKGQDVKSAIERSLEAFSSGGANQHRLRGGGLSLDIGLGKGQGQGRGAQRLLLEWDSTNRLWRPNSIKDTHK